MAPNFAGNKNHHSNGFKFRSLAVKHISYKFIIHQWLSLFTFNKNDDDFKADNFEELTIRVRESGTKTSLRLGFFWWCNFWRNLVPCSVGGNLLNRKLYSCNHSHSDSADLCHDMQMYNRNHFIYLDRFSVESLYFYIGWLLSLLNYTAVCRVLSCVAVLSTDFCQRQSEAKFPVTWIHTRYNGFFPGAASWQQVSWKSVA